MHSEATILTVLRELLRHMDRAKIVLVDDRVLANLQTEDIGSLVVPAALQQLVETGRLERIGDALYRVTHDGEMTIPMAPDVRQEPKRRTMAEKIADQQQREAARLRLLDAVYERTQGNPEAAVLKTDAYADAGLPWDEGSAAFRYLEKEGLLEGHSSHMLAITHEGVKEREAAVAGQGAERTDHFPAAVIIQTFHNVGSVQTGGQGNMAHVRQSVGIHGGDLVHLTEQLRNAARDHGEFVLKAAERIHELAKSKERDKTEMKFLLKGFETIIALAPFANAIATAISGVGG
jgi:hypothetical protein